MLLNMYNCTHMKVGGYIGMKYALSENSKAQSGIVHITDMLRKVQVTCTDMWCLKVTCDM